MIPKKPGPDLIRAEHRFSEKIMLQHLSRIAQLDQRTALADHVRTRRKRTCGLQGGGPGLTHSGPKPGRVLGAQRASRWCATFGSEPVRSALRPRGRPLP